MKILITEKQLNKLSEEAIEHEKNKWYNLNPNELYVSAEEILDMIIKSYSGIGGHPEFNTPLDIARTDLDLWMTIDVDEDPEWDATLAGKKTLFGKKWTVMATDGGSVSKRKLINQLIQKLKRGTNYIEASDRVAEILTTLGLPYVQDEDSIKNVIKKDDVQYKGDGWYQRKIGAELKLKRLFGKPKV
jgi:hypothetical protein